MASQAGSAAPPGLALGAAGVLGLTLACDSPGEVPLMVGASTLIVEGGPTLYARKSAPTGPRRLTTREVPKQGTHTH